MAIKVHFRFSIHFAFRLKKNAAQSTALIYAMHGENAVNYTICKWWYKKFRKGDFSLEDDPRAGRPQKIETNELQALLDINSAQTEKELLEQLGVTQQAISVCLHTMRQLQKEGWWISHELFEDKKNRRRDTTHTLLSKFRKKEFFHKIITGDEKWILYDNPKRRKSWIHPSQPSTSIPKTNTHIKNVLPCIWWDWKGVLRVTIGRNNHGRSLLPTID